MLETMVFCLFYQNIFMHDCSIRAFEYQYNIHYLDIKNYINIIDIIFITTAPLVFPAEQACQ